MRTILHPAVLLLSCILGSPYARGAGVDLILQLPERMSAKSAAAANRDLKLTTPGIVNGATVTFPRLLPTIPYDVRIDLAEGSVLQGVDLGWYTEEPAKKDAGPLKDEDREQIRAIVQDIKDFYNKK